MSKVNYWEQIEEAFEKVEIYESYDEFKRSAAMYPEWKIDILAVHWTMSEIANGGLEQCFSNSTGILAPEAVLGFERIGKPELANHLRKAMTLLGETYPREREDRVERLAALTGAQDEETEGFSIIPKWVAQKTGMEAKQGPFDELDDALIAACDEVDAALDEYAGVKVG
jgi:hypothetical protein